MIVLHIFRQYLNITENWIYRILTNFTGIDVIIGSEVFKNNQFQSSKFHCIRFPVDKFHTDEEQFYGKIINFIQSRILGDLYLIYLMYWAKKYHVQLVHSHYGPTGWNYRWLPKLLKLPHVISFYGFDYEKLPATHPVWNKRYSVLFNTADAFLCEGNFGAKTLRMKGCPADRIHVVHLGLESR